eukprot:gene8471-293_t
MQKKIASKERFETLDSELKKLIEEQASIGNVLKELKEKKATKEEIEPHKKKMAVLKKEVEKKALEKQNENPEILHVNRGEFEEVMTRRFFYIPSFEIYGGCAGFYDYGPSCCAIKDNIINLWKNHFIIEENLLELSTSNLTIERVFEVSGHVSKFSDFMVDDLDAHDHKRADKLIKETIDERLKDPKLSNEKQEEYKNILIDVESYKADELDAVIKNLEIKTPSGKDYSPAYPFNLMFSTKIGPTGKLVGYLRPELAQGIFLNFKRLLNYNNGQMPFGSAVIGQAFRNEISPRAGLLRVREFALAEIEYFINPEDKSFKKFKYVKDVKLSFFPRENQMKKTGVIELTIEDALKKGILNNETHAYFIGRTYEFVIACGLLPDGIRFRQHLATEMAHYATDCWDCELLTSYGWIECVGLADRSAYDLSVHAKATNEDLTAFEPYKEPIIQHVLEYSEKKGGIGKAFGKEAKKVQEFLKSLTEEEMKVYQKDFEEKKEKDITVDGKTYKITDKMCEFKVVKKSIGGKSYIPSVIEPSFGIGRIIYAVLEHAYWVREDEEKEKKQKKKGEKEIERTVLSLTPEISPFKAAILPLQKDSKFDDHIEKIRKKLTSHGISYRIDDSNVKIGRRYARTDEIGIPFGITIDFDSLTNDDYTLRDRDSCTQIRAKLEDIVRIIQQLVLKESTWDNSNSK